MHLAVHTRTTCPIPPRDLATGTCAPPPPRSAGCHVAGGCLAPARADTEVPADSPRESAADQLFRIELSLVAVGLTSVTRRGSSLDSSGHLSDRLRRPLLFLA